MIVRVSTTLGKKEKNVKERAKLHFNKRIQISYRNLIRLFCDDINNLSKYDLIRQ